MNIGFFGDSYVAFDHHHTWGKLLLAELDCNPVLTGKGGTNQYYAIDQWQQHTQPLDMAVFTFTWHHRLYHNDFYWDAVVRAEAEARVSDVEHLEHMVQAVRIYRDNLYNDEQARFLYELMVKWCLDLPAQHPETKFIFLPNTESSRLIALKYFQGGVLFDFAFETISNNERLSPGPIGQVHDNRPGHLSTANNKIFKDIIKNVIENYHTHQDQIYALDYNKFDLKTYPKYD